MTDDYKKGLIVGLAMKPLFVGEKERYDGQTYCGTVSLLGGIAIEECYVFKMPEEDE